MAVPVAPIAGLALRYGAVAIAAYAIARNSGVARRDQRAEDAMDETHEGVHVRRDREQMNASGRVRRVIRFGQSGPGVEIDATALTRIKIKRI